MAKIGFIEVDITADISHIRAGLASASSLIRDFSLLSIGLTSGINNAFKKISAIGLRAFQASLIGVTGVLVLSADGSYDDADKAAEATVGRLVMAVDSGTGTKTVMSRGYATNTGWAFTAGQQLFVAANAAITATPPGAGEFAQVVGYATAATTVYFNPSPDYIEVEA